MQKEQPLWQAVGQFFTKLNILILYDSAIVLLANYPKGLKLIAPQKYAHGYLWKLYSELPNLEEMQIVLKKMNMLSVVYPQEYFSALKRNELTSNEKTWRDL